MDVDQVISEYIAHLSFLNHRPTVISQRRWALGHLVRYAAPRSVLELDEATVLSFVARETLGAEARNSAISHVRGFYQWAIKKRYTQLDPTADIERPRRPKRRARPMPTDAVTLALSSAPDPIRHWLYLATYGGLRACEIAQLSGGDFVLEVDRPYVIIQEAKGGDTQVAGIGAELLEVAHELAAIRGWCFPKGVGDPALRQWAGHVSANQVQKRANRFLHSQGITQTEHQLRHWFGTELLRSSGGNLRIAQEGLRHANANSTVIYTEITTREIGEALDALPRLIA